MEEVNKDLVKIDYLQGMKYKDIASKFDVSIDTVKSWVKRYGWAKEKAKVNPKGAHKEEKKAKKGCTQKEKVSKTKKVCTQRRNRVQEEKNLEGDYEPIPYIKNKNLNDKQKLFCIYYIKCFNATKAYQKAYGCEYSTALTNGSALLGKACIREEIERLKADKFKGAMLSAKDLLQKYIDIALSDINDYMEYGHEKIPAKDKETGEQKFDENGKPIYWFNNYVILNNSKKVDGTLISEISEGKDGIKIKLLDKKFALDFLAKYSNLLDIPTQQKLDIERRKIELDEKQADTLDDDIEYTVEGGTDEDKKED